MNLIEKEKNRARVVIIIIFLKDLTPKVWEHTILSSLFVPAAEARALL